MSATVDPDPKKNQSGGGGEYYPLLSSTVYDIDTMRGIQNIGSGLKWLAQDRTWLTDICRIGVRISVWCLNRKECMLWEDEEK